MAKQLTTQAQGQGSKYSDQDRRKAIACYVIHGNIARCSKLLNIPQTTLKYWRKTEWWLASIDEIRHEKQDEVDAGISKVIDMSIDSITDRLRYGDEVLTSKGERLLKKVSARDSATIFGIAFDKQRIMRNLPTTISSRVDNTKLLKLQQQFEAMASKEPKIIDGTVISES